MTSWVRKIHDFAFEFEDIIYVYRCIHRSLCSFLNKRMTISTVSGYIAINQNKMIAITTRGEVSASSEYFCSLLVVPYSGILNFRSTTVIKKLFTQKYCTNSGVTFDTAQMTLLLDYSSGIFLSLSVLPTIFLPNQKKQLHDHLQNFIRYFGSRHLQETMCFPLYVVRRLYNVFDRTSRFIFK